MKTVRHIHQLIDNTNGDTAQLTLADVAGKPSIIFR